MKHTRSTCRWLYCFGLLAMADPGLCYGSESAKKTETLRLELKDEGAALEFTSEFITDKAREINLAGYTVYDGGIWQSVWSPPHSIIRKGVLTLGGKPVHLDVSGMANAWVEGSRLEPRFVRLQQATDASGHTFHILDVCFVKGGAEDYGAQWVIAGHASMRTRLEALGDTFPDWVAEKDVP